MCIDKIFFRFGKNRRNVLLGVTHNSKESLDIINFLMKNYNFQKYFIELNTANKSFILQNYFIYSEFFPILIKFYNNHDKLNKEITSCKTSNETLIKLIDISLETEIKIFSKINNKSLVYKEKNILQYYIEYKLSKYIFYKIWDFNMLSIVNDKNYTNEIVFLFGEEIKRLSFFQTHILFREFIFLHNIKEYLLLADEYDLFKKKELNFKKYFGENHKFFLEEADELSKNKIDYILNNSNDIENYELQNPKSSLQNQLLVVVGQHHFDNIVNNGLL